MCSVNQTHRAARCPTCFRFCPLLECLQVYLSLCWLYANVKCQLLFLFYIYIYIYISIYILGLLCLAARLFISYTDPEEFWWWKKKWNTELNICHSNGPLTNIRQTFSSCSFLNVSACCFSWSLVLDFWSKRSNMKMSLWVLKVWWAFLKCFFF